MVIVFPGDEETRARDFLPRSVLISELLPTLERPERAICGRGSRGNPLEFPTVIAISQLFVLIFIILLRKDQCVFKNVICRATGNERKVITCLGIDIIEIAHIVLGNEDG